MTLPFFAIYLSKTGILSTLQISSILSISGLTMSLTSFVNGIYLDRTNNKNIITYSLIISGLCYICFSCITNNFILLLFINGILGWLRSLIDINIIKIIAVNKKQNIINKFYSARFASANFGVIIGPIIGTMLAEHHTKLIFYLAGNLNIILGFFTLYYLKNITSNNIKSIKLKYYYKDHFHDVLSNKILIIITIINFLLWGVYAMLDTTIPLYLSKITNSPSALFTKIIIINAVLCILFQTIILKLAEQTSLKLCGIVGCLLFTFAFIILSLKSSNIYIILSAVLISFAELLTLPINNLFIIRIAPKHLIASYNGFANLSLLGISIGPLLGGIGLAYLNQLYIFLNIAIIPTVAALLYLKYIKNQP